MLFRSSQLKMTASAPVETSMKVILQLRQNGSEYWLLERIPLKGGESLTICSRVVRIPNSLSRSSRYKLSALVKLYKQEAKVVKLRDLYRHPDLVSNPRYSCSKRTLSLDATRKSEEWTQGFSALANRLKVHLAVLLTPGYREIGDERIFVTNDSL